MSVGRRTLKFFETTMHCMRDAQAIGFQSGLTRGSTRRWQYYARLEAVPSNSASLHGD